MRAADSEFDRATALTASPVAGERAAHLDDQWRIGNGINGGLLMAIGAAALRTVEQEHIARRAAARATASRALSVTRPSDT